MKGATFAWWAALVLFGLTTLLVIDPELCEILPSWLKAYRPELVRVKASPGALLALGAALGHVSGRLFSLRSGGARE